MTNKTYVIKDNYNLYYSSNGDGFSNNWVKDINLADIFYENDKDAQNVSTYAYVLDAIKRFHKPIVPSAHLVEVKPFYFEVNNE